MEELTCQNEELRKVVEFQNGEQQRTTENQNEEEQPRRIEGNNNEEESDSHINRRTRASEENLSRMESELCNIRREMDELKNAMKEKVVENLDGMIRRTDFSFTTEVLNRPLPPKLSSTVGVV